MKHLNIAIDGPSCSGKTTISKLLAQQLKINHLSSGSVYRAIAVFCNENKIDYRNEDIVKNFLEKIDINVSFENNTQHVFLNNRCVDDIIERNEISIIASIVSQYECVRNKVKTIQKNIATNFDIIIDGRDICYEILPNADYKFFITAKVEKRAQRRYEQALSRGENVNYEQILHDLKERDYKDENRALSPLKFTEGSTLVDTTDKTVDQTLEYMLSFIKE